MADDLTATMEDYLESILELLREEPVARVTDIAEKLDVSKPRVTTAVKRLSESGHVEHQAYGYVLLTEKGREVAEKVQKRHELLARFFERVLGVDGETAAEDACQAEHHVSQETLDKLTLFIEFIEECPRTGPGWLEHFHCSCGQDRGDGRPENCGESCLQACLEQLKKSHRGMCGKR